MPRLSVALSAGTTMSRLMRSTIFISREPRYHGHLQGRTYGGNRVDAFLTARLRLDQAVAAVLALVHDRHAPVGIVTKHQERLVQQVELHDRVRDRHRLRMELLGLDDLELRWRR